jgi:AcrR family transcriptional regulator
MYPADPDQTGTPTGSVMPGDVAEEPVLRADARRNRDQIIAAASHAFAAEGADVPMEEIARRAGVGVGTLYRRFADREALVLAVIRDSVEAVVLEMRRAAAEEPLAWDALVCAVNHSRQLKLSLRASNLLSAGHPAARDDARLRDLRSELIDVIDGLVTAAQREGTLRPDVGTGDVMFLFSQVYRAPSSDTEDTAVKRALEILLDGLRIGPKSSLPGQPLSADDVRRAVRRSTTAS